LLAVPLATYSAKKPTPAASTKSNEPERLIKKSYDTDHKDVSAIIDDYVQKVSLREPDILKELRAITKSKYPTSDMVTDPIEGQLFRMLLSMLGAKNCIEVGTYTGYNALNMCLALPDDGKVTVCDISEEYLNVGLPFFKKAGVDHKLDVQIRPASETLHDLIAKGGAGKYDFVYIDADKTGYNDYYEKALILVRQGGLIAVDNVLWGGRLVGGEASIREIKNDFLRESSLALHALNQKIMADSRVQISMLKIADGVTICLKL